MKHLMLLEILAPSR